MHVCLAALLEQFGTQASLISTHGNETGRRKPTGPSSDVERLPTRCGFFDLPPTQKITSIGMVCVIVSGELWVSPAHTDHMTCTISAHTTPIRQKRAENESRLSGLFSPHLCRETVQLPYGVLLQQEQVNILDILANQRAAPAVQACTRLLSSSRPVMSRPSPLPAGVEPDESTQRPIDSAPEDDAFDAFQSATLNNMIREVQITPQTSSSVRAASSQLDMAPLIDSSNVIPTSPRHRPNSRFRPNSRQNCWWTSQNRYSTRRHWSHQWQSMPLPP